MRAVNPAIRLVFFRRGPSQVFVMVVGARPVIMGHFMSAGRLRRQKRICYKCMREFGNGPAARPSTLPTGQLECDVAPAVLALSLQPSTDSRVKPAVFAYVPARKPSNFDPSDIRKCSRNSVMPISGVMVAKMTPPVSLVRVRHSV